jgi:hypothetical protein
VGVGAIVIEDDTTNGDCVKEVSSNAAAGVRGIVAAGDSTFTSAGSGVYNGSDPIGIITVDGPAEGLTDGSSCNATSQDLTGQTTTSNGIMKCNNSLGQYEDVGLFIAHSTDTDEKGSLFEVSPH